MFDLKLKVDILAGILQHICLCYMHIYAHLCTYMHICATFMVLEPHVLLHRHNLHILKRLSLKKTITNIQDLGEVR